MKVQEHTAYQKARQLADIVWRVSKKWNYITLSTLGNQLIRSTDSISANLAEGWNRYTKKDKINFYVIARGSTAETSDWMEKAYSRNLIDLPDYIASQKLLEELPREINGLIKGTKEFLKK